MGSNDEGKPMIVTLTKFKKMSSTHDLHETAVDDVCEEPCQDGTVLENPTTLNCTCDKDSPCVDCAGIPVRGRPRRKSWCVESSLKKQFNRNSLVRRTLERSEGLPPLGEAHHGSSQAFPSPGRWVGLIDQRLRRLRVTGKAMTVSIPSERRKMRPSIFDSGRRRNDPGFPLTLAGLKARRKSEGGFILEGIRGFPNRVRSTLNVPGNTLVERRFSYMKSHQSLPPGVSKTLPMTSVVSTPTTSKRDISLVPSDSVISTDSSMFSESCSGDEGSLLQEILSYNSWRIGDMYRGSPSFRKRSPPLVSPSKEIETKLESDKSLALLQEEEHFERGSDISEDTPDLAKDLRRHIHSFADRLHLTKDRLEDTAKCYYFLDKAYEWALEAMKVVGRVKSAGAVSPDEVEAASEAIGNHMLENPPVSEDTFTAMIDLATRLNNETLLQQCKMAHVRCKETVSLLRSRQAALIKAHRQMEFDCQSYIDLNDILSVPEDQCAMFSNAWFNNSGRKRSIGSTTSRPKDLSRCSSFETDDESLFSEGPYCSTPSKTPVDSRSSLRNIKELRESQEDVSRTLGFVRGCNGLRSSVGSEFRLGLSDSFPLTISRKSPVAQPAVRAFSSDSSSCSSSGSSEQSSERKKERRNIWQFTDVGRRSVEDANDRLEDSIIGFSSMLHRSSISSGANSHLLIRGSQINLSNSEDLTQEEVRRNKTLLLIMQELIQTERDYVNSLEYIIENYIPETAREDIPQALRGQRNVIFGNIEKIFEFHSGYFLKALENCESKPFKIGSVFLRFENQFYLYALYNKNKPKSDDLMAEFGTAYFKEKQMMLGDKMDLASYLLKPVQRMGKYALLLKQLLKECSKSEEGFDDLKAAQEMVQFQLRHGNDLLAMDSLRDCDVNLKEQGRLLRQGEFLVSEGSRGKKSLRHVFLFEDLILFSKARKDPDKKNLDIFQYKLSLKTTDIGITAQVGDSPLRFEIWFRKRKPADVYLLQSPTTEVKEAWTEEISKLLWRQALRNRKMRLHEMSSMGIGNKPCLDIKPSEDQINDRSVAINKAPTRPKASPMSSYPSMSSSVRRPHSVISVSSSSSSAESSTPSSAGPSFVGTLNLGFESGDSPKPLQRSVTRTSQCSAESGIVSDLFPDRDSEVRPKVERSNSTITTASVDSALSPSVPLSTLEEPSSKEPQTESEDHIEPYAEVEPLEEPPNETPKTLLTSEVSSDALLVKAILLDLPQKIRQKSN